MKTSAFLLLSVTALLLRGAPAVAAASVACNPMELSPCAGAILTAAPPTPACCAKLKEQQPCFCQYKKNPNLKGYINSDNSKKVSKSCGVPIPTC
ncbi:non-specific lipid-transfer protein 2-like [Canna indica]|uniref:Non-specific lipid-transfer protein 2-like n=1 Tax=Canna indica TaxID=4628 RepID=A0AAQ3Q1D8_9LILI|nr:non-specific lipid-transfer protein 2-like [Canna indica]